MYGDFSRFLSGLSGQYSGVLAQQGRLLLDADLNEQNAILLDYLRRLTTDLIGPFAGRLTTRASRSSRWSNTANAERSD